MRDPGCQRCPLSEGATSVCIEGDGALDAPIWILGEAPGADEDRLGRPFVGQSGKLIRTLLNELGYDADQVRITNAVRCRPPANRKPTTEEQHICAEAFLYPEMAEHKPAFVIALGNEPLRAMGRSGITNHRGTPYKFDVKGTVTEVKTYKTRPPKEVTRKGSVVHTTEVLPTFHPAYILRFPEHKPQLRADLAAFKSIIDQQHRNEYEEGNYVPVTTVAGALEAYEALRGASTLAADIETYGFESGLDPRNEGFRILSISFTPAAGSAYVFSVEHPITAALGERYIDLVRRICNRLLTKVEKAVYHNGLFDVGVMKHHWDFRSVLTYDTMCGSHLLDENSPNRLKDNARTWCGAGRYEDAITWKTKDKTRTYVNRKGELAHPLAIPEWDVLWPYNARDTDYTMRLYEIQKQRLRREPKLVRLMSKLVMPAVRAAVDLQANGVWLDRGRIVERMDENAKLMKIQEERILSAVPEQAELDDAVWCNQYIPLSTTREQSIPRERFNVNSNPHLIWLLHELRGLPVMGLTPKGAISLNKQAITALQDYVITNDSNDFIITDSELLDAIVTYRKHLKWHSTYFEKWLTNMDENGLFYQDINVVGTVTGRWSGNFQQVPREPLLRSCVGAPPGWLDVDVDLSQIEMRLVADAANDVALLKLFLEGGDPHFDAAIEFFRVTAEFVKANKEYRSRAKPGNFGYLYGMFPQKFIVFARTAYKVIFTLDEAKEIRAGFFRKWAQIGQWHRDMAALVRKQHYVESPIGRKRRLPQIVSDDRLIQMEAERLAVNNPIQGFASDIMLMAFIRSSELIREHRDEILVCRTTHDSLGFRVREDRVRYWAPLLRDVMRTPPLEEWFGVKLKVNIEADVVIGQHWGEAIPNYLEEAA